MTSVSVFGTFRVHGFNDGEGLEMANNLSELSKVNVSVTEDLIDGLKTLNQCQQGCSINISICIDSTIFSCKPSKDDISHARNVCEALTKVFGTSNINNSLMDITTGHSLLTAAAARREFDIVQVLAEHGWDVNYDRRAFRDSSVKEQPPSVSFVDDNLSLTGLPLYLAVTQRDTAAVVALLQAPGCYPHAAVNTRKNERDTPLHSAMRNEDLYIFTLLCKNHLIDPSVVDDHGRTPLHLCRSPDMAKVFREAIVTWSQLIPSSLHSRNNTTKVDPILVSSYANEAIRCLNTIDNKGRTALHYAVDAGNHAVVKEILTAAQLIGSTWRNLVSVAKQNGWDRLQSKKYMKGKRVKQYVKPPISASRGSRVTFIASLEDPLTEPGPEPAHLDIDCIDVDGLSALSIAAYNNNWTLFKELLLCGADVTTLDEAAAEVVLLEACRNGNVNIVGELLQAIGSMKYQYRRLEPRISVNEYNESLRNKKINSKDDDERDEESSIASNDSGEENAILDDDSVISAGSAHKYFNIDINIRDDNGYTPLLHAIQGGSLPCVELLCDAGADVDLSSSQWSPLQVAVTLTTTSILNYLLFTANASVNHRILLNEIYPTALHLAVAQNNCGAVRSLLRRGADINSRGCRSHAATPLEYANNHMKMILTRFQAHDDWRALYHRETMEDFQSAVKSFIMLIGMEPTGTPSRGNRRVPMLPSSIVGHIVHYLAQIWTCDCLINVADAVIVEDLEET